MIHHYKISTITTNILNFDTYTKLIQAKFMWKLINKNLPNCIYESFYPTKQLNKPIRNTRFGSNFFQLIELHTKNASSQRLENSYGQNYQKKLKV